MVGAGRRPQVAVTDATERARRKFRRELQAGANALRVLGILAGVDRPLYGVEIIRLVKQTGAARTIEQGTAYHVLRSLSERGLVMVQTRPTGQGPPRKYYVITPVGREVLSSWIVDWRQASEEVDSILESAEKWCRSDPAVS